MQNQIEERLQEIKRRVAEAAHRSNRDPASVTVMAVTKTQPVEVIAAAYNAGLRCFGESRVQEALARFGDRSLVAHRYPDMDLQMIGHLQSNKARDAAALFGTVQSVDSLKLVRLLASACEREERTMDILLEVNSSREQHKFGFTSVEALFESASAVMHEPRLCLRGLMTIAPYTSDADPIRRAFGSVAEQYHRLRDCFPESTIDTLSMGMSNDYEIAVEQGATMVRLGTELFGART